MPRRRIKLGGGSYINVNKRSTSLTRKLGGMKLTTSGKRTTATSRITKGLSVTVTNGKVRYNRGQP